ncbi:MAG: YqgE/AlgH family protein [Gammaproteobacteria bacterium]|nr:YqgE/AlgH family protein [Gammaproteobacteria bacterium]MDH5802110.1 YqgE/AlgH family protein [Gammaproteobacteria bacterium]
MRETCLTNQFLIAMPGLADPNFFHSVTYICEHNKHGAMGIVINQPVDLTLGEVVDYLGIKNGHNEKMRQTVFRGGPVETDRGFVLHNPLGKWESTLNVTPRIGLSTSNDIVEALARGEGPEHCLVALGYAGWGAGQLERELGENAWINCMADEQVLFHMDSAERWQAAVSLVGIDLNHLSGDVGHA